MLERHQARRRPEPVESEREEVDQTNECDDHIKEVDQPCEDNETVSESGGSWEEVGSYARKSLRATPPFQRSSAKGLQGRKAMQEWGRTKNEMDRFKAKKRT